MKAHFEPHDGIIDGDSQIPSLGRYVDHGDFWAEDYVLTIDHLVYDGRTEVDDDPDIRVRINGREAGEFFWMIETDMETDTSVGYNPKEEVYHKP